MSGTLGEVLASPAGLDALRGGQTLQEAVQATKQPKSALDRVVQFLTTASSAVKNASAVLADAEVDNQSAATEIRADGQVQVLVDEIDTAIESLTELSPKVSVVFNPPPDAGSSALADWFELVLMITDRRVISPAQGRDILVGVGAAADEVDVALAFGVLHDRCNRDQALYPFRFSRLAWSVTPRRSNTLIGCCCSSPP